MPIGSVYNLPQGRWDGNNFQFPLAQQQPRLPFQMALDPFAVPQPQPMQTSGVQVPSYITEGTSRNQGPGEAGLGRGPADIGYSKGQATADMTTTATDNTKDFAKSVATGLGLLAGGLPAGLAVGGHTLFGQTPMGYIGQQLRGAMGGMFGNDVSSDIGMNPAGLSNPGVAQVGQANDPYGGGTGLGQGASVPGTEQVGQANDPFGGGTGLGQGGGDTGSAK
jgi:hypothetical protein